MNFEEWLEANGLETGLTMSPSSIITRKDGKPAWSKNGHDFIAYSDKMIYEAGQKNAFTKEELSRLLLHLGPKSIDHPNEHDSLVDKIRNLLEEK
jgi:hypothetical protein